MNALEQQLHYPLGTAFPGNGECLQVAPGVKWIRMALPFALDHINLWLIRDTAPTDNGVQDGWAIVDCCIHNDDAKANWEKVFADHLDGLPVLRVIVTHMHPDHIGLAHWLCTRWNVQMWISATDYQVARFGCMGPTSFGGEPAAAFFAMHGLNSPDVVEQIRSRTNYFPALVPSVPPNYRRLLDGALLQLGNLQWRCISGYGHAPEHMALYCAELGLLIGGDMMLPRISTNVSVYEQEPEANALALFLDSIDKFRSLPAQTLVLPSHGKPFTGLHQRIQQLHDHHQERLQEVMQACSEKPCSAADIIPVLFKRAMDMHQTTFAMGESIAHLHMLWYANQLTRTLDADGVLRFFAAHAVATSAAPDHP
jgi:glyoxylase-like metal-dependent hydrolase (beta-lactamase superfamily II)